MNYWCVKYGRASIREEVVCVVVGRLVGVVVGCGGGVNGDRWRARWRRETACARRIGIGHGPVGMCGGRRLVGAVLGVEAARRARERGSAT